MITNETPLVLLLALRGLIALAPPKGSTLVDKTLELGSVQKTLTHQFSTLPGYTDIADRFEAIVRNSSNFGELTLALQLNDFFDLESEVKQDISLAKELHNTKLFNVRKTKLSLVFEEMTFNTSLLVMDTDSVTDITPVSYDGFPLAVIQPMTPVDHDGVWFGKRSVSQLNSYYTITGN